MYTILTGDTMLLRRAAGAGDIAEAVFILASDVATCTGGVTLLAAGGLDGISQAPVDAYL